MEEKFFYYIMMGKFYCVWFFFKKYEVLYLIVLVDCKGWIVLYVCCFFGDDVIMRFLLKNGVNVRVIDSDGNMFIYLVLRFVV